MSETTPFIQEQLKILTVIARHGMDQAHKGTTKAIQVDCWQHMQDELKFLCAMLQRHPPYKPVIDKTYDS